MIHIHRFIAPGRLWLLLAVAVLIGVYVAVQFRRRPYAMRFSNLDLLDKIAPKRPGWKRHAVAAGYLLALAAMVLAVAQPIARERVPKQRATIILAIDTSLSMEATDVAPTRIAAAKKAAVTFVKSIPKALNVGLVSFDITASLRVRPTTDRAGVTDAINRLELHQGTAIGDAVDESLRAIREVPPDATGKAAPAVIVLLSDGATTSGKRTEDAIPDATQAHISVFTIAFGTLTGTIQADVDGSGNMTDIPVPVDRDALALLAKGTKGRPFIAESADDLSSVYDDLGSAIGYDTEDREVTWKVLTAAIVMMVAVGGLSLAWFQRLP